MKSKKYASHTFHFEQKQKNIEKCNKNLLRVKKNPPPLLQTEKKLKILMHKHSHEVENNRKKNLK